MCGIAGKVSFDPAAPVDRCLLHRMTAVLRHRGPDDEGVWVQGMVGLGSRRLAIIDLSPRGHQPMANEDGSLTIAFNGEIYNFQELRADLERRGHCFRSDTDTETILYLYEEFGVHCLERLRGMFALAIWDAHHRTLFVARDRLGKKPLFYYHDHSRFVFGSEPKALLQDPGVRAEADPEAIHHFLTYGYVPSPWSAFKGVRKLPPAHYLLVKEGELSLHRYWSLEYQRKRRSDEPALVEELLSVLKEAVRLRLISDVPLGALLSGGLDSATVVALMRELTTGPVRTFSIGFDEPAYDELRYARLVAERFETDHHEYVVRHDAVALLPKLVWHYNEPFADSSAIPTFAVSELARRHVTVALNGDGGDESFLGYDRYLATMVTGGADVVPRAVRRSVARAAALLPVSSPKSALHRLRRISEVLDLSPQRRYARWLVAFSNEAKAALYTPDFASRLAHCDSLALLDAAYERSDAPTFVEATAHADVQLYLPDDLLVKMDIASMAHSLEVRSPFLDHEVVEFAASLPRDMKLRRLTHKYLIKRAMRGVLPEPVLRRRKMGFGVPLHRWLRGELREMAYDVLLDSRATARGYFRLEVVRRYLDEHARGDANHHVQLWCLLMLELWHRMFIDRPCPPEPVAAT